MTTIHESQEDHEHSVHAPSGLLDTGTRVLKHDDTFLVCEVHGDVLPRQQLGLYHHGTRHLSRFVLRVEGQHMLLLGSTVRDDNILMAVELMNPDLQNDELRLDHGTVHLRRERLLWRGALQERIEVTSFAAAPVLLPIEIDLGADFVDLFEVRGTPRARRGTSNPPEVEAGAVRLSYIGLDQVTRETRIAFAPAPATLTSGGARFRLQLEPLRTERLTITVACCARPAEPGPRAHHFEDALHAAQARQVAEAEETCAIETSNELFNEWLRRSRADLQMMVTQTAEGPYPYAGVPWFSTPFGRDAIITALEAIWIAPSLAAGVLSFLAARQADTEDDVVDAEPGKILHEMRVGEMAALGEVPFACYYGSIDATPLFLVLAGRYHQATGDLQLMHLLWPNIQRALEWIDRYGDRDGDGFVEYSRRSERGLEQQGWKDSHDSVFYSDGTPARGPIALCEVQGYVYAARLAAADIATALGETEVARKQRARALALRDFFEDAYWCEDIGTYALALDGNKRPCRVRSSNAGHSLFSGIARADRAERLATHLLGREMFSGWGVRTLATAETRYNPMAYHNGSVWPHDNALIAAGLASYGFKDHALRILGGLFGVSHEVEQHRLPELFCGFDRRPGESPTLYPVACAPQSWAAAAIFMLLGAALGLTVEAAEQQVVLMQPALPPWLEVVRLRNLRVGQERVDMTLRRHPEDVTVTVDRRTGPANVIVRK